MTEADVFKQVCQLSQQERAKKSIHGDDSDPPTQWITVTPDIAKRLLKHNTGNRRLSQSHVKSLADQMRRDEWMLAANPIRIDWNGVLLDSQHTLTAIVESETTQRMLLVGHLNPMTQIVIDRGKRRSAANAIEFAYGANTTHTSLVASVARLELMLCDHRKRNTTITVSTNMKSGSVTDYSVVQWILDNPDLLDIAPVGASIAGRKGGASTELKITPRMATWLLLMFTRACGDITTAQRFFIVSTDQLQETQDGDPRVAFRNVMNSLNQYDRNQSFIPGVLGVKAWNAWRRGSQIKLLKITPNGIPTPLEIVRKESA